MMTLNEIKTFFIVSLSIWSYIVTLTFITMDGPNLTNITIISITGFILSIAIYLSIKVLKKIACYAIYKLKGN